MLYYLKMLIIALISGLFTALPVSFGAHYAYLSSVLSFTNDKALLGFYYAVIATAFSLVVFGYLRRIYRKAFIYSVFTKKGSDPSSKKSYRKILGNLLLSLIPTAVLFIPVGEGGLLLDIFTNLLQENYLLVTASCCVGSGLFLLIAVWYTRQHYAETVRSSKPLSVLRFSIYQLLAYLLPGVSNVSIGGTSLLLTDVEPKVLVREMLLYLAPSMFVVNVARIVRYILSGIVLNPVMIAIAAVGSGLGSLLMIHLISKFNLRKHFVFFAVYSIVFGLFIAVSAFVF